MFFVRHVIFPGKVVWTFLGGVMFQWEFKVLQTYENWYGMLAAGFWHHQNWYISLKGWLAFQKAPRVQCLANYHSHGETHWKIQPFWLYLPAMMGIFQPAMLLYWRANVHSLPRGGPRADRYKWRTFPPGHSNGRKKPWVLPGVKKSPFRWRGGKTYLELVLLAHLVGLSSHTTVWWNASNPSRHRLKNSEHILHPQKN